MDTSLKYIRMAGRAEEIQELSPIEGDSGFHWRDETKTIYYVDDGRCYYRAYVQGRRTKIWLPRQDELQKILGFYPNNPFAPFKLCTLIYEFVARDIQTHEYGSMEQLWLALVMQEEYGKVWKGSEWSAI